MMFDTSHTHGNTELSSCESELLHLSGRIQGHGALLAVDLASRRISHVSANAPDMLGMALPDLMNAPIFVLDCCTPELMAGFDLQAGEHLHLTSVPAGKHRNLDLTVIRTADVLLLEFEKEQALVGPIAIFQLQRNLTRAPSHREDIAPYYDTLVRQMKQVGGFDRVMLYRFRSDWTGVVEAEACDPRWGSYLGLRFPAEDIPQIARDLYLQNPYRMIPDVDASIHPIWALHSDPPDLTLSVLRSVSPMHLQYLHHMGVRATFSLAVVVGDKLWGLVACHHYEGPLHLTYDQRQACVSMSSAFSLGLATYMSGKHLQLIDSLDRRLDTLLQDFHTWPELWDSVPALGSLWAALVDAHGFAVGLRDQLALWGQTPSQEGLAVIDPWFVHACDEVQVAFETLPAEWRESLPLVALEGGMLAVKVWTAQQGWLRLYWFRQSEVQQVAWAGSPHKPSAEQAGAPLLSPRRSFERWVEIRMGYCVEWSTMEKLLVAKVRSVLGRMR